MISHLVRAKQLPATDRFQLKIDRSDVIRFTKEKMLTPELSRQAGIICKLVPAFMARLGTVDSRNSHLRANQIQGFFWGVSLGCDGPFGVERRGLGADGAVDHWST